jgi:signal transduction histidine kinase/ligand-binding sensor domain-containing protein
LLPILALVLGLVQAGSAAAFERHLADYQLTAWGLGQGAPPDIWALEQSADGDLWLGTGVGLYRFDGLRFERIPTTFRSNNITALLALPNGDLWIGFFLGGSALLRAGQLTEYGSTAGMPGGAVYRFARDRDGRIWAATDAGLAYFSAGRWQRVDAAWGYPEASATWVLCDTRGALWVATGSTVMRLGAGQRRFEDLRIPSGVSVLAEDAQSHIWLSDEAGGTRMIGSPSAVPESPAPVNLTPATHAKRLLFTRSGELWGTDARRGGVMRVGSADLALVSGGAPAPTPLDRLGQAQGLTADLAVPVLEDREGNLWVGTNLGLNRLRSTSVIPVRGIPTVMPRGFALAPNGQGGVWVGMEGAVVPVDANRPVVESFPMQDGDRLMSLISDRRGGVWVATHNALLHARDGQWTRSLLPPVPQNNATRALALTPQGVLWMADVKGLWRREAESWTRIEEPTLPGARRALALAATDDGLWRGYSDGTVDWRGLNTGRSYGPAEGLDIGSIASLVVSGAELLVGGDRGVARWDGTRFQGLDARRVPQLQGVSGIVRANDGDVWMNTLFGIVHLRAGDFNQALLQADWTPPVEVFDSDDGLPGVAQQSSSNSTAVQSSDGRVWFATNRGVCWLNPQDLVRNEVPPPVSIRGLSWGNREVALDGSPALPSGERSLAVSYTGLSLAAPEQLRYRYRLKGLDTQWQDAGRRQEAVFANLAPGAYEFEVLAVNADGVRSVDPARVSFRILPRYYETWWFQILVGLALAVMLSVLYLLRLYQLQQRMQYRLQERMAERERIARDLHDTLLQGVQGLTLRIQAEVSRIEAGPLRSGLEDALDRADEILAEGRDRVVELRSGAQPEFRLHERLKSLSALCGAESYRYRIGGVPEDLRATVADEVYLIAREAVTNAVRHASARHVGVVLAFRRSALWLRVTDDGVGLPESILGGNARPGHWGMRGMQERAQRLRARLRVEPARKGSGTVVALKVPAASAYLRRFRWLLLPESLRRWWSERRRGPYFD